jgi:O-antigen ligase
MRIPVAGSHYAMDRPGTSWPERSSGTAPPWTESSQPPRPARAQLTRSIEWRDDLRLTLIGLAPSGAITAGMLVGSSALVLLSSLVALAAAVLSPMVGLIVLAFVAPLPRPTVVPPPGIWIVMIGAITAGLILRLPIDRPRPRLPSPELILAGAFLTYVAAHVVGSVSDGAAASGGRTLIDSLQRQTDLGTNLLVFAATSVVLRNRSPWPLIAALLVSAGLAASSALLPLVGIEGLFDNVGEPSQVASRSAGFFFDPNYFAAYLAAATALAFACATFVRSVRLRALLILTGAVFCVALVATLSRGGLLALVAGIVTIGFSRGRKVGLALSAALVVLFLLAYPFFAEVRFSTSDTSAGADLGGQLESSGRIGTWAAGIELFQSSPLFGIGFGEYAEASPVGIAAHNWYVGVLAEGGIVGACLWAAFIAAILVGLRRTSHPAQVVGYSVLATWLVASMSLDAPRFYRPSGLVMFSLAAALAADWLPRGPTGIQTGATQPGVPGPDGYQQRRIAARIAPTGRR